jgi:putative flippase GtrA
MDWTTPMDIHRQFSRYAIIGVVSNLIIYLAYLLLTASGIGHKTAMTFLYIIGVLQTFFFNKNWSFQYDGASMPALRRYIITYGFGYLFNLAMLMLLVDFLGYPHQIVQGIMIIVVAVTVFLLQRYWVFRGNPVVQP